MEEEEDNVAIVAFPRLALQDQLDQLVLQAKMDILEMQANRESLEHCRHRPLTSLNHARNVSRQLMDILAIRGHQDHPETKANQGCRDRKEIRDRKARLDLRVRLGSRVNLDSLVKQDNRAA